MKNDYTQKTLASLREDGMRTGIVEKFNYHVKRGDGGWGVRQDLWGFIDIIALDTETGETIAVQSTSGNCVPDHRRKILGDTSKEDDPKKISHLKDIRAAAIDWLICGNRIQLWGWRKVLKKRGGKQKVWKPRVIEITLADFQEF